MEYKTVADARELAGLRLVLTMGVPGPWGEAAKGIFHVKGIPYTPVGQVPAADNDELLAWTGFRNAPIAVYGYERPLDRWLDILMLAERLESSPPLLPAMPEDRAVMIGLANEICGEWGFGWCRRAALVGGSPTPQNDTPVAERMRREYGVTPQIAATSPKRIVDILTCLTRRLKSQRSEGSPYLVGPRLTALDIYWACFAALLEPLPNDVNPMADWLRQLYTTVSSDISAVKDPILFEHRDFIYRNYLQLPLDY